MKITRKNLRQLIANMLINEEASKFGSLANYDPNVAVYYVKADDNLTSIHMKKGNPDLTVQDQIELNKKADPSFDPDNIRVGQKILLNFDPNMPAHGDEDPVELD